MTLIRYAVPALLAGLVLSSTGCAGWEGDTLLGLRHRYRTVFSGSDGYAKVRVPRDDSPQFRKLLMSAQVVDGEDTVYVDRVEDADGNVLHRFLSDVEVGEFATGAVADQGLNHFNWPISDADPDIEGDELVVVVGAVGSDRNLRPNAEIDVQTLQSVDDNDFTAGAVNIIPHYAGGVEQDTAIKAAFDEAIQRMRDIYAEVELDVQVQPDVIVADGTWPRPGFGAPEAWQALSSESTVLGVDVLIVDTIAGSDNTILGAAGSIPGGLIGSEKSGVIISAYANAGPDLVYSDAEIDLLAGTLAHELGHYMGLFHPVEAEYDRWDALDDTDRCTGENACRGALGTNLMYPSALCTQSSCAAQEDLSLNQASVVHRYTGVN